MITATQEDGGRNVPALCPETKATVTPVFIAAVMEHPVRSA
jgi:hypothetical protein